MPYPIPDILENVMRELQGVSCRLENDRNDINCVGWRIKRPQCESKSKVGNLG